MLLKDIVVKRPEKASKVLVINSTQNTEFHSLLGEITDLFLYLYTIESKIKEYKTVPTQPEV